MCNCKRAQIAILFVHTMTFISGTGNILKEILFKAQTIRFWRIRTHACARYIYNSCTCLFFACQAQRSHHVELSKRRNGSKKAGKQSRFKWNLRLLKIAHIQKQFDSKKKNNLYIQRSKINMSLLQNATVVRGILNINDDNAKNTRP